LLACGESGIKEQYKNIREATMSAEETRAIADQLIAYCRSGDTLTGLRELYDPAVVSVEAMAPPSAPGPATTGVDAVRGKHEWWYGAFEVHSSSVDGPYPHGDDRFALIFEIDCTEKATGRRSQMKEVGVYTVSNGKIVREEFFYPC